MSYVFDPDTLRAIAQKAQGLSFDDMNRLVVDELERAYPGHVDGRFDYIFNLTSGGCGMMKILHASITEYVILFGSAIGTEAFSGRYRMDIYDWVITGEMSTFTDDRCGARVVSGPGDWTLLPKGRVKGWRIRENTWMLEYGRGFLPSALPLALSDLTISAMEWRIALQTLGIYGRHALRELRQGKL
jgi:C-8 sterol isomerase